MSDEPGAVGREVMTAMQNNVVLMKIASNLPPRILMKLRSTCKTWNKSFVLVLRSCSDEDLILSWFQKHERGLNGELKLRTMRDYTECMRRSLAIPFSQYIPPRSSQSDWPVFEDFLSVCGNFAQFLHLTPGHLENKILRRALFGGTPNLTSLTLLFILQMSRSEFVRLHSTSGIEPLEDDANRLQTELPRLRRLRLTALDGVTQNCSWWPLVKDILWNAVNLDTLELHDFGFEAVWDLLGPHSHNLKTFRIRYIRASDLQAMVQVATRIQNPLRLEKFTAETLFQSFEAREEIVPLYQFLATQSTTLRQFELYACYTEFRRDRYSVPKVSYAFGDEPNGRFLGGAIRFPRMEALRMLRLGPEDFRDVGVAGFYNCGSLAHTFPQLQRLECHLETFYHQPIADVDAVADAKSMSPLTHEGVKHVILTLDRMTPANEIVTHAWTTAFPSVTHLKLILSTLDHLPLFIGIWPGLNSLHIKYREWNTLDRNPKGPKPGFLDAVLSGVAISNLEEARRHLNQMAGKQTLEAIQSVLARHKSRPGLSDLHHLNEFVLEVGNSADRVTDVGGYLAFAVASPHLKRLRLSTLKASGQPSAWTDEQKSLTELISAECRQLIKNSFHMYTDIDL